MSGKRANELRRRIARTLRTDETLDEWTKRELRRSARRLRSIERHEDRETAARSKRYASREAREAERREDREARDYWQAIADGAYDRTPIADAPAAPRTFGAVGDALRRAVGGR